MGDLSEVIAAWITGKPTGGLELLGLRMSLWGRIGKFLLYVAGILALVDLADPENLHKRGSAARERALLKLNQAKRMRDIRRWLAVEDRVFEDMVLPPPPVVQMGPKMALWRPKSGRPQAVPDGLSLALADYRDFHRQVVAALPSGNMDPQHQEYVRSQVRALIATQLSENERHLVQDTKLARDDRLVLLGIVGLVMLIIGSTGVVVGLNRAEGPSPWLYACLLVGGGMCLAGVPRIRLSIAGLGYLSWSAVQRGWGSLLVRTRSEHVRRLRVIAAFLAILGGAFDVLSS